MKSMKWIVPLLVALPALAAAGDSENAKVVTSMSNGAQCISPVHIQRIDGREVQVNWGGFELEPGQHTMSGKTLIDTSICSTVGRGTNQHNPAPLQAEFEAGKTYWVGFDHKSKNRNDWKYVIWKIKD